MIEPEALEDLLHALTARGFRVVGPTVRDGAIVYEDLDSAAELPIGWTDDQDAGRYRLERRDDEARFGYAVGPHSWKQFLLPARIRLWRARRRDDGFEVEEEPLDDTPLALIGVRACELHGDRDPGPRPPRRPLRRPRLRGPPRRTRSSSPSTASSPAARASASRWAPGPKADAGYDLALTEILDGAHRFLVEVGSERGAEVLARPAAPRRREPDDLDAAGAAVAGAAEQMGRQLDTTDIRDLLARNLEHERWDDVADALPDLRQLHARLPDLLLHERRGRHRPHRRARRARRASWDSCFSVDHSYIHGGSIRPSGRSRYRQWLTHKFGTWHDQFDTLGLRRLRPLHHLVPGRDRRDRGADRDPRRAKEADDGDD